MDRGKNINRKKMGGAIRAALPEDHLRTKEIPMPVVLSEKTVLHLAPSVSLTFAENGQAHVQSHPTSRTLPVLALLGVAIVSAGAGYMFNAAGLAGPVEATPANMMAPAEPTLQIDPAFSPSAPAQRSRPPIVVPMTPRVQAPTSQNPADPFGMGD